MNSCLLKNKNAIITGAHGGIGMAAVKAFAENGANIWACDIAWDDVTKAELEKISEENGVWIKPVEFEMTHKEEMKQFVFQINKEKTTVDVLVNNAGILNVSLLSMLSMEKAHDLFEINFFAHLQLTQLVSRIMMKQKSGSIVSTSSYIGLDGSKGQVIYGASKAAIASMTQSLAKEFADYNIRVNAVAPGVVNTKMIKNLPEHEIELLMQQCVLHRTAEPIEIANVMAFLASDLSSYVTGQIIRVDGGM